MYILSYVKYIANWKLLYNRELNLVLCDNLEDWGGEVGLRFKRQGIYAYLWLIHADVWQKPTQHCKAIIL